MTKNQVQFQRGLSLPEYMHQYGGEQKYRDALFHWRWAEGFVCPECGHVGYREIYSRRLFQCHWCHHQTSVTSGTIMEGTKLPLVTWFLAMHSLTPSKNNISALARKRKPGVSYNAARRLKHEPMQAMKERDDGQRLKGIIQLDDVYSGGGRRSGKRGRGAANKSPFVAAVAANHAGEAS